jgi:hypothetical protein
MAVPGAFGVGSQTYGDQVPVKERTKLGEDKIRWKQKPSIGGIVAGKIRGVSDTNIPISEQGPIIEEKKAKDLEKIQMDKIRARVLKTGNPEQFAGKMVYVDRGVIRTKDFVPDESLDRKSLVSGVSTELNYLGIPFTPNYNQADDFLKTVIRNNAYKSASKDQRRAMMNRFILFRQGGGR